MDELDTSTPPQPTRQAIAAKGRSGKLTVSGRLKVAMDLMLFEGACRADAAAKAGMTDHSLRAAFKRPHVKAYYNAGLQVLRDSERARNILAFVRVRDTSDNGMAVIAAGKALEQLSDDEANTKRANSLPGLQIVIVQPGAADPPLIDVSPKELPHD